MSGQVDTKKKLLLIMDYLMKYSDENNPVTTLEIIEMLDKQGIKCERKSVYNDIKILSDYGLDIITTKQGRCGYYIGSREFELVEVRLLVDAVQSASFITASKSKKLIKKIGNLCSEDQMRRMNTNIYVDNRVKRNNEKIFYTIDTIARAIEENKQIQCQYKKCRDTEKLPNANQIVKTMIINPYATVWANNNYYLIGNNTKYQNITQLRIDRIKSVELIEKSKILPFNQIKEAEKYQDIADYTKHTFNMYSGETTDIEFHCSIDILEQILDKFGDDVPLREDFNDSGCFYMHTQAQMSDGLVSWIMQFSNKLEVIRPEALKEQIKNKAMDILALYEK